MPRLVPLAFSLVLLFSALHLAAQRGDNPNAPLRPPAEQQRLFHVPPGFEVQLVASEPDIQKPFNLAFDARGRVWVTGSALYPWPARRDATGAEVAGFQKHWDENHLAFRALSSPPAPPDAGLDSIRVLSDFEPDGRARTVTTFADGLNIPIGICPLPREPGAKGDTVIAFSIPAIWRFTDLDGDGKADRREKLYDGFGFKDTHGMSSSYWLWHDGWIYGTHGFANVSEVTDRNGRTVTLSSGNTYRFRPDGTRFEIYAHGQTNPYGLAFDPRGEVYTADSHSKPVYLLQPGGYYEGIGSWNAHDGLGFAPAITEDTHGSSAIAGIAHYAASQFPAEFRDNLFNGNPVTRRINRTRLDWRGSSPLAVRQPDFLTSDDPSFRPVQVKLGPDGALWIADFYNPIIGHYEAPLTHPDRDRTHGRIWRVVWRGLDGAVPVPSLPDLTREPTSQLVARLLEANATLQSLASAELMSRDDRASVVPHLQALADRIIAGTEPALDPSALLPLEIVLARLGASEDRRFERALARGEGAVSQAALRALATRDELPANFAPAVQTFLKNSPPDRSARLAAGLFQRHPEPWQAALLLDLLERTPEYDAQLRYALRLALKAQAATATLADLNQWSTTPTAAERLADVCLAVHTPAAAEFLLGHLERTRFKGERAGNFARHAVRSLPPERMSAVRPLLDSMQTAPVAQRLAVAEGLAAVAGVRPEALPEDVQNWMERELVAALADRAASLVQRAATALKPLAFPAKGEALQQVALAESGSASVRIAALRALTPADPATAPLLRQIVGGRGSAAVRRVAAQLLADAGGDAETIEALTRGFADAPADLAVALAAALARTRPGAERLFELVQQKRVPASVLRHRYIAAELDRQPPDLTARAAGLTRDLPPENARLDAIIAERLQGYTPARKTERARGAALFAQHCAACHAFQHAGGTLGPSLDGIGSRDITRLFEDILDPSRNVDPAFRLVTVTLRNGETRSGLNQREENGRILLTDPATGESMSMPRADVAEVAPSPISAMPAGFESLLSAQELLDLIDYLRTPAGAAGT